MGFTPERTAQRPSFAYFPFGDEPHHCIGNTFALPETLLAVATIESRYQLRLGDAQVVPDLLPALPAKGVVIAIHTRK